MYITLVEQEQECTKGGKKSNVIDTKFDLFNLLEMKGVCTHLLFLVMSGIKQACGGVNLHILCVVASLELEQVLGGVVRW